MAGRKLEVDLVANARPFNNTLDAAANRVTGFKKRLEATGGGSLTKGLAIGAGVASFNLLTSAVSAAVGAMDEMHNAFLEDQESQARLAGTIKNTVVNYEAATKAAEDFATAQIDLGFADQDTRDSINQLIGQTHDWIETQKLATLAGDLARAKNIDLAQATDVITKAYNGQGRAVAALGIDIQGVVGREQLLERVTKNVSGAMQVYATTSAGRLAKANAKMDESMEKLGGIIDKFSQAIIPPLVDVLGGLATATTDAVSGFENLAGVFNQVVGPAFEALTGRALTLLDVLQGLAATVPGIGGLLSGGGGGAKGAAGQAVNIASPTGGVKVTKLPGGFGWPVQKKHTGGIVSGPAGSDQLILARAGENVQTKGQQGGQTIIVNIASFIGSDRDIDRFTDRIAFRLRATSLS